MNNVMYGLYASTTYPGNPTDLDYKTNKLAQYQSKINNKFIKATSCETILEEYPYGSFQFRELVCRVTGVKTVDTGLKLSDSYKKLTFMTQEEAKDVGYLYKFKDNYWITCNTDIMSGSTDSTIVRRCNNILKWKDDFGNIKSTPISFEEDAYFLNNEVKQEITRGNGYRKAIVQKNADTLRLRPNQRFIIDGVCFKVSGNGITKFLHQYTEDKNSPYVIRLNLEYDYINPDTDDLLNGIADVNANSISVTIDQFNNVYSVSGNEYTFTATTIKNTDIVDYDLVWRVSDPLVAQLTQVGNIATIKFLKEGSCSIGVYLQVDNLISDILETVVNSNDNFYIECNPILNKLLKGQTQIFEFNLINKGEYVVGSNFDFEITSQITSEYLEFNRLSVNSFSITNKKMCSEQLSINCIAIGSTAETYVFKLELGGAW